jgi:transcriptional regulator with XRE-family HTH domain
MGFKENLKAELSYSGMLVKELSVQSGINRRTIDNYLSSHNCIPSADAAVSIARVLGVSVEYLVTGQEAAQWKSPQSFSPEARSIARIAEQLEEKHRKIALALVKTLKELEENEKKVHNNDFQMKKGR